MNIINPPFSFVQFSSGGAPADCDYLLPVALNSDLKFQSIISTSGAGQSNAVAAHSQKLYVVKSGAIITDGTSLSANTLYSPADSFSAVELEDEKVLICWSAAITGIEDMADNTCFRLCLKVDDGTTVSYYLSNCFQKISDTKYYNTLEYYCTADNYGFSYCDGCSNKVRLPLYLGGPQVKEDQTAYIFSDGTRKLTKYQAGKLFEVKVGTVPEDIHNKITTMLAHDIVSIDSPRYSGGIRKDGDYTIAWDRPEDLTAPASTKAYATPYIVVNDNCAECADYVPCVVPTVPDFTLADAAIGIAYHKTITLTGSTPFTLSSLVRPSWMNITVSGTGITFSGTPGSSAAGTGITVSFTASNACGSDNGSATINVSNESCVAVGISGTPALPDAELNVPYSYSFTLTGNTPFTLSNTVKPSWMSIALNTITVDGVYEYQVKFSGTPDTVGTAIDVSVRINNCSDSFIDFSDTIDVNESVDAHFGTTTFLSNDQPLINEDEIASLVGAPDVTATVILDTLINDNGGILEVNGTVVGQGDSWNVVLSETSHLEVSIRGQAGNPGTRIFANFTITEVSSGNIGTPDTYQISKTFS